MLRTAQQWFFPVARTVHVLERSYALTELKCEQVLQRKAVGVMTNCKVLWFTLVAYIHTIAVPVRHRKPGNFQGVFGQGR